MNLFHAFYEMSPGFRSLLSHHQYQVFEFPFFLTPMLDASVRSRGQTGMAADEVTAADYASTKDLLSSDEKGIRLEWGRPPYEAVVLCGRDQEGLLLVHTKFLDGGGWKSTVITLIRMHNRVICLDAFEIVAERDDDGVLRTRGPVGGEQFRKEIRVTNEVLLPDVMEAAPLKLDPLESHSYQSIVTVTESVAMQLLNCRNIKTREELPPRQTRRALERKGLPVFSSHVLEIVPGQQRGRRAPGAGAGIPLALHWVRGHFKDYSEKGLGRAHVKGIFWWGPHLAGRADRVVEKEYRVKREGEPAKRVSEPERGLSPSQAPEGGGDGMSAKRESQSPGGSE